MIDDDEHLYPETRKHPECIDLVGTRTRDICVSGPLKSNDTLIVPEILVRLDSSL